MVLIDSSVWIDYLAGARSGLALQLDRWLADREPLATAGIILQEVLQGIRREREFNLVHSKLSRLAYLSASKSSHRAAALLFRKARALGVSVPSVDALIAALAVEHNSALFTADVKHF